MTFWMSENVLHPHKSNFFQERKLRKLFLIMFNIIYILQSDRLIMYITKEELVTSLSPFPMVYILYYIQVCFVAKKTRGGRSMINHVIDNGCEFQTGIALFNRETTRSESYKRETWPNVLQRIEPTEPTRGKIRRAQRTPNAECRMSFLEDKTKK
jgi:hypothetical protein